MNSVLPRSPAADTSALHVTRLASAEAFGALTREWEELDARLFPWTPFTGPLWNRLWWKHYRSSRLMVHDELFVHSVRDGGGRLVAVAPMMLTRRPSAGPVQGRVIQCFGADRNLTEIRGIACQPQDCGRALRALNAHFVGGASGWDWIDWGVLREDGTGPDEVARSGAVGQERSFPSYHLPLPASWDELRGRLGRNIKESLRKCYNSLKRDGHTFELRVVDQAAELAPALETFFRLHQARAEAPARCQHTNVFANPGDRAFVAEYAGEMARRRQLCLFQLVIAGQVVATRMGFALGDELYLYYSGYDMAWARYSVMTTLLAEAIKWAIARKMRVVGLSTGQDVAKTRWSPQSITYRSAIQVGPGWRSRAAFGAYDRIAQLGTRDTWLGKLSRQIRR
jgi:CelD/BcsL family acetyltransferase involved in cellulose biosynthesis